MSRQHNTPYIVINDTSHALRPVENVFKETWLQDFIFTHSESLPIAEIEPVLSSWSYDDLEKAIRAT